MIQIEVNEKTESDPTRRYVHVHEIGDRFSVAVQVTYGDQTQVFEIRNIEDYVDVGPDGSQELRNLVLHSMVTISLRERPFNGDIRRRVWMDLADKVFSSKTPDASLSLNFANEKNCYAMVTKMRAVLGLE